MRNSKYAEEEMVNVESCIHQNCMNTSDEKKKIKQLKYKCENELSYEQTATTLTTNTFNNTIEQDK